MTTEKIPKISVCVVAYNQENYILRCLQSIVDQNTDFCIEVIVADDCSTDNTASIIKTFSELHPLVIKPIFHKNNIGPFKNYISAHKIATGRYISHIDGDDFFLPGKLLEQSKYLDKNTDCVAVVHKLAICNHDGELLTTTWPVKFTHQKYSLSKLALNHPEFGHSSLVYRTEALRPFLDLELDSFIDFQIYIHLASQGLIGVIDRNLGCYTRGIGISTSKNLYKLAEQALHYGKYVGLNQKDFQYSMARQHLIFAKKALVENNKQLFKDLIALSTNEIIISKTQYLLSKVAKSKMLTSILEVIIKLKRKISALRPR